MKTVKHAQCGHSLMELVTAMGLSFIVISGVYFVWNYINIHVVKQSIVSELQRENQRLLHLIASQIRHSPAILDQDHQSISFVSENQKDTMIYEFDRDTLRLNDLPVTILLKSCTVSEFRLEDISDPAQSDSRFLFLKLTLALRHEGGTSDTSSLNLRTGKVSFSKRDDFFR
ncbi:MAG: hypothetical protein GX640_14590 [Fibrobacter sp.]|nr:hypothetical protein [Fibrobacter sp.]